MSILSGQGAAMAGPTRDRKFHMVDQDGVPHLKRWRIVISCWKLAESLSAKRCTHLHGFKHSIEGSKTNRTALYPKPMAYSTSTACIPEQQQSAPLCL